MSLLNSKVATDFCNGIHNVTVVGFGETQSRIDTRDDGEVKEIKATIFLRLKDDKGAADKHTIFLDTTRTLNEDGIGYSDNLTEAAQDQLNRIIAGIKKQFPDNHEVHNIDELGTLFEYLKTNHIQFKVFVSETPRNDGIGTWKNFSYAPDVLLLAGMRKA